MGAALQQIFIPVLGIATAAASVLAAPFPASANDWWRTRQFAKDVNPDDYLNGDVYKEFDSRDWWYGNGVDDDLRSRAAFFRGKRLTRDYRVFPDGTHARVAGGKRKHFTRVILFRAGQPYLEQIPQLNGDTATWQPFTVRRPRPITGRLTIRYARFEKTQSVRPHWDCSVYYKDVCRWNPGHPAVGWHKVRMETKRWKVTTKIGADAFTTTWRSLGLGWWNGDVSTIPAEFTNNPMLPVIPAGTASCGVGNHNVCGRVLTNEVTVARKRIWN